ARRRTPSPRGEGERGDRGTGLRASRRRAGGLPPDASPSRSARPRGGDRGTERRSGARGDAPQRGRAAVRTGPDRRLVRAAAAWTAGAVAAVVWPALAGPLAGALAVLVTLVVWDC